MKYSDLSTEAKERAMASFHECDIAFDFECVTDDVKDTGEMFGFSVDKVYCSGFYSQGDGCCITGSYRYEKGALAKVKAEWPICTELHQIVRGLQDLQRKNFYALRATVSHGSHFYCHSHSNDISVEDTRVNYGWTNSENEVRLSELLRDYMDLAYKWLTDQYEYSMSEESFLEACTANEWDFNEEGEIQ